MKYEKEITVEVDINLKKFEKLLEDNNFKVKEVYDINDIYLVNKDMNFNNILDLLNNCVLIRHLNEKNKESQFLTYKYKEYNDKDEITKQGKVNCYIYSVNEAIQLFKYLNYIELIRINDHCTVY